MKRKILRGTKILVTISTVIIIIIMVFTVKKDTFEYLKQAKPIFLLLTFIAWLFYILLDGYRVQILARALNKKIPIRTSLEVILSGLFLAAVTPFQTGGLPVQLYILSKKRISAGQGTLILLFRGILGFGVQMLLIPFIIYFFHAYLKSAIIGILLRYFLVFYVVVILFFIIVMKKTDAFKHFVLNRIKKYKDKRKIEKEIKFERVMKNILEEVNEFKIGLKLYFARKKLLLLWAFLLTLASMLSYYFMAPLLLYSLGQSGSIYLAIAFQVILQMVLLFMPTPGASGIAEGSFVALFQVICPSALLGIYTILWRFFTFYIGAGIGGFIFIKVLHFPEPKKTRNMHLEADGRIVKAD
ncbi:MAG: flippase-like domain-containing protein [Proteobacteria bacterium]|nr:flippase-like domain-containing protein [Pseudomonadota bacterium]